MKIDEKTFRDTMAQFPTGVTVVTTSHNKIGKFGVTISSLTSVSLTPPLVLFCLGTKGHSIEIFRDVDHFAFNILANHQTSLSHLFASRMPIDWNELNFSYPENSTCPLLSDSLGYIVCEKFATYPGGDHEIIVGHVKDMKINKKSLPLIRHAGQYRTVV
ncbi:Flavin reductase family protein [Candidatus Bealeia paramacronuclearis]|uniref:Flavin reductase family protein n=1 Tax=Candidatus Bealeia paramacronuclearis TaxID=1921001 RepID=A0ABZ2C4A4_9PROT|nr:Flavin reductase family protein [Candidatus Bealeia paramacronuclearis]